MSEEILRRVRKYSSANKDIPFKTTLFIYSVTTPFIFITATLKQHENTGNKKGSLEWNIFVSNFVFEISFIFAFLMTKTKHKLSLNLFYLVTTKRIKMATIHINSFSSH